MEDEGLCTVIRIASNGWAYELSLRATTVIKFHGLYEDKRVKVVEVFGQTTTVVFTGDYWTSLSNHNNLQYFLLQ